MDRMKRTQFWGKDEYDDRLIQQIMAGVKTATACPADEYYLPDGEYEDGGFEEGDLVEVYDLQQQLRCIIRITEVYGTGFSQESIPEKLWQGEANNSAKEFLDDHRNCWSHLPLSDDFQIIVNHFELVRIIKP